MSQEGDTVWSEMLSIIYAVEEISRLSRRRHEALRDAR
jgi:hypothetical protein